MQEYTLKIKNDSHDFDYIDQDGISHESPQSWLWSILGGCGCGSSEHFGELSVKLLNYFATPHAERKENEVNPYDDERYEILAHWFDEKGLIDHGGSIGSSWLTEKGEQIHKSIKLLSPTKNYYH